MTVKTFTIKKMTFSVVISAFVFTQTTSIKIQLNCYHRPIDNGRNDIPFEALL